MNLPRKEKKMIKSIREYTCYNVAMYDIVYTDGKFITRVRTVGKDDLPKTAIKFMEEAVKTELLKVKNETENLYERRDA